MNRIISLGFQNAPNLLIFRYGITINPLISGTLFILFLFLFYLIYHVIDITIIKYIKYNNAMISWARIRRTLNLTLASFLYYAQANASKY